MFFLLSPSLCQKLQIWDTAGQERFRSITQSYYRSANALILTYDITCEESFRCLPEWLREIEQYASNKVITVLVGKWPGGREVGRHPKKWCLLDVVMLEVVQQVLLPCRAVPAVGLLGLFLLQMTSRC